MNDTNIIIVHLNELKKICDSNINYIGSIASIISILITFFNTCLIFKLIRNLKNRRAINNIKQKIININKQLKRGGDIPSNTLEKIISYINDIKKYRFIFMELKLKKIINEIKQINSITDNQEMIIHKLELLINELEDVK